MRSRSILPLLAIVILFTVATPARAGEDSLIGLSAGYSSRFEKGFLSGDLFVPLGHIVDLDLNVQYLDLGAAKRYVLGADALVSFPLKRIRERVFGYAGGGVGVVITDVEGQGRSSTRDGVLSLLAGIGYDARATPFLQVKLAPHGEVLFSVGVRFY